MYANMPEPRRAGWYAVALAAFGFLIPVGVFLVLNSALTAAQNLAWAEGAGFEAFVLAAVVIAGTQIGALRLGIRTRSTVPGQIALAAAGTLLLLVAGVLALVFTRWSVG